MNSPASTRLSNAQRRLWVAHTRCPQSVPNLSWAYRIRGPLDVRAVRAALRGIVERHTALRIGVSVRDGEPRLVAGPVFDALSTVDRPPAGDPAEREARLAALVRDVATEPFDLCAGPLLRIALFGAGDDDHVLAIAAHALVLDTESIAWFEREFAQRYAELRAGGNERGDQPAPPSPADDPVSARDAAYWRTALAGAPAGVDFPLDGRRKPGRVRTAARASIVLAAADARGLAELGRAHGATLFPTLLAAVAVVLARYSGQTDVVIGGRLARAASVADGALGSFERVVAYRIPAAAPTSFVEVLQSAREAVQGAFDHPLFAHEPRDAARQSPWDAETAWVSNVTFGAERESGPGPALAGLTVEPYPLGPAPAAGDLDFRYQETPLGLGCRVVYDASLFEPATIERLLQNFSILVRGVTAAPAVAIGSLPILAPAELRRLLDEWNPPPATAASDGTVSERFERIAARTPDAVAVADGAMELSYRELNGRTDALARILLEAPIGRDEIIAVAAERSVWTVVCMLAILKAGAAYLPLDPEAAPGAARAQLAAAGVRCVLAPGRGGEFAGVARVIDPATLDLGAGVGVDSAVAREAGDLAYVMFTSGSTGRAKGVLVTQRAILNLATGCPALAVGPDDVVAQLANVSFDGATFEIWGALLNGARLDIIARDVMLMPTLLADQLRERRISVAFLTPALLRHVSAVLPTAFATLRLLIAGGEVLDPAAVRALFAHGPPGRLLNGYGPSETTTFATTHEIDAPPQDAIPIGRPLTNVQTYVLDAGGNLVPIGVVGQLFIGGLGVARGYLNDPELTARTFVRHPFSTDPDARMYATGDRVRYRSDGILEFLGRDDRQIKLRGFRIEIDEIETALKAQPGVADAIVTLHADERAGPLLVAYVAERASVPRDTIAWRAALGAQLPEYMLPAAVVTLDAIPLNANGKTDLTALAALFARERARAADAPREALAPAERTLARIFTDVLGIADIGRFDDFFAIGGNSLLAARAVSRIGDRFGVDIALRDFFGGPSIAALARTIAEAKPRTLRPLHAAGTPSVDDLTDEQVDALLEAARRE